MFFNNGADIVVLRCWHFLSVVEFKDGISTPLESGLKLQVTCDCI